MVCEVNSHCYATSFTVEGFFLLQFLANIKHLLYAWACTRFSGMVGVSLEYLNEYLITENLNERVGVGLGGGEIHVHIKK